MQIRTRFAVLALLVSVAAVPAWAQLSEQYQDWDEGPVRHLMTREEQKAWNRVRSDADAKAFIDLFWARRDPTPATPVNEWKDEFERRVAFADENFTQGRTRGSMTDRGKVLILLGAPTRRITSGEPTRPDIQTPTGTTDDQGNLRPMGVPTETWVYETPQVPQFLDLKEMEIAFVDQNRLNNWKIGRSPKTDVTAALRRAQEFFIFQPSLQQVPTYEAAAPVPAAPAEPEKKTAFESKALEAAVREFRATETSPYPNVHLDYGEYITGGGDYFVPVQLWLPREAGLAPNAAATFFGVVEDAEGNVVGVWEEPITVSESRSDLYVDHSLQLDPGEYTGTFGVAVGEKPVAMASASMKLAGIEKEVAGVSELLLSNNVYPLSEAQLPTDPFAFGGIKVVPKGDRRFQKSDELWYFFELRNPGLDENSQPKVQVGIDVTGEVEGQKKRFRLPLTEVQPQPLKGVDGHWAVGSAIPLTAFEPGEYTMEMKIIDTVGKNTWNLKETFRVVE